MLPPPRDEDPEDVSWALSTAEALWSRGEYNDAVAWIRRAATAASEAEADMRVVELAKAAAELQALVDTFGPKPAPVAAPVAAPPPAAREQAESGGFEVLVDFDATSPGAPAVAPKPAAKPPGPPPRPPGPPPKKAPPSPRLPTPNPMPSPLTAVAVEELAGTPAIDEPLAPPPVQEPPPPSHDPDSLRAIPSVPPSPPDFAPTPMAMRVAKSIPPDPEPPLPVRQVTEPPRPAHPFAPRSPRTSTAPLGSAVPVGVPRPARAAPPAEMAAIEVPPRPGVAARTPPPPAPPRAPRAPTPPMGSVPPPKLSLVPSAVPAPMSDEGVQHRVSDAPPRVANTASTSIPGPPRMPTNAPSDVRSDRSSNRAATLGGFPSRPPGAPAYAAPPIDAAPMSRSPLLLDPDEFEVLADVPDDAREAMVARAVQVTVLPDEVAIAPSMVIVLQGDVEVRARGFVTRLDSVAAGQVRLLAPFAPAYGDLELVGGLKGARYLALDVATVEALRAAAPWVVQELEPASDDVHVVAGALRGRHGQRLDGGILDAVLARAKTMRLGPGAKVVKQGEPVRALILLGAGELTLRDGEDSDAPIMTTMPLGEILFTTELLSRAPAPRTVRAGPAGALVIVATRSATEELLVTVPPLLELLGDS